MVETRMCRGCGRLITFVKAPAGHLVACDSFSVQVLPDKSNAAKQFLIGNGKAVWGRKVPSETPGAVTAWEPHSGACANRPAARRKKTPQKTKAEIAEAQEAAEKERRRVEAKLLAQREAEWARGGYWR